MGLFTEVNEGNEEGEAGFEFPVSSFEVFGSAGSVWIDGVLNPSPWPSPLLAEGRARAFGPARVAVISLMAARDVEVGLGDLVAPVNGLGAAVEGIVSAEGWACAFGASPEEQTEVCATSRSAGATVVSLIVSRGEEVSLLTSAATFEEAVGSSGTWISRQPSPE